MTDRNRREFLADVGRGMLVASVGSAVAADLGLASARAAEGPDKLSFGGLEPMVALMQETPVNKLLPTLVARWQAGTDLRSLVAAAALANARTFGGQDYTGFHTFMALAPAFDMARELPENRQPLPVLKVLYRNTNRIHEKGGSKSEVLHPVEPASLPEGRPGGELLREATRRADWKGAEATFATLARGKPEDAFNDLQFPVQDEVDVHRVVLAWRAWAMLGLTGKEQAHTLLRQSVRYCLEHEQHRINRKAAPPEVRSVLPKLLDQYKLLGKPLGKREPEDAWVDRMCQTILTASPAKAADAVAAALAEGMAPESVGEAIALAANQLLLCQPGGRTHGDSDGLHASDAANAWRNIARVSNHRNTVASLIVGAYHTAGQFNGFNKQPYPGPQHVEKVKGDGGEALLREAEEAIRANNQIHACAVIHRYGQLGLPARPVFDLMLRYAISEDGRLHAEKYYRTVTEEFATTRPAFRWRQLTALARVTASAYGFTRDDRPGHRAPGYEEACRLLKV
jgi:hypothetical protein